jgi:hypothetical protein
MPSEVWGPQTVPWMHQFGILGATVVRLTMLPISVEPRANANMTALQPPWVNSLALNPVARFSIGVAAAKAVRASVSKEEVCMSSN